MGYNIEFNFIERKDLRLQAEQEIIRNIDVFAQRRCILEEGMPEKIFKELIINEFVDITSPEELAMIHTLILDPLGNYNSGCSIKPGNIILNIKKLIDSIPSAIEMGVSLALDIPILKICAALNLWRSFRDILSIQITKNQAFLIVSLWNNCDSEHRISIRSGFDCMNSLLEHYGEDLLSYTKYNYLLDSLEKIGCLKIDNGIIWLREWISKQYTERFKLP